MLLETHQRPTIPRPILERRADSPFYQAHAFIDGRQRSVASSCKERFRDPKTGVACRPMQSDFRIDLV